ncbi:hypothetical protein STRTUCAR8_01604 [Streptomyces turgidiscabies Car8]|uniref:Uncharacterized protein n=1 Tax=Streptomyces turgidiscabies (strain Car8) TaxID=698760 RepID=L7F3C4_STRT8|nr:hypothetical protein STRTUCAR8_01604 [Streptomyces turgidiscabies Car8]
MSRHGRPAAADVAYGARARLAQWHRHGRSPLNRNDFTALAHALAKRVDAEPDHARAPHLLATDCLEARAVRDPDLAVTFKERAARYADNAEALSKGSHS